MSLLTVLISFKDGSERTINNVLSIRYFFKGYRYKFSGFVVHEGIFDELDLVDKTKLVFRLDSIDSLEVF